MSSKGQYVSNPVKYLGKLYVDRTHGDRPNQELLFKAVGIIKRQAPSKNKPQIAFFTTGEVIQNGAIKPAALCGRQRNGTLAIVQPMITIVSIGHTEKAFVYVTVEPKQGETGILRFWIHAFSCKSKQQGVQLATHMISCCTRVRNMYRARRAQGQGRMKMSKDGNAELPAGAAPQFNDTMVGDSSVMVDNQECDDINLTLALDAATSMLGGQDQSMSGDFQNMTVNEDDYGLISDALDEMYDLDCTLQKYRLPEAFRSQLLDAWQKGYSEGGSVTQKCGANPANVLMESNTVRI